MANIQYPQHLTENIIQDRLDKHFEECQSEESPIVKLFYKLENLTTFTLDTKALKNIIEQHIKATLSYEKGAVKTYMKHSKMSSQFSTISGDCGYSTLDRSNVVYSLNCSAEDCNAAYYGHTTK